VKITVTSTRVITFQTRKPRKTSEKKLKEELNPTNYNKNTPEDTTNRTTQIQK